MNRISPESVNYSSAWNRMLYGSPLHTARGKVVFALIMAPVLYMSVSTWVRWLTPLSDSAYLLLGILMALLGSILGIAILRYLDRRQPESWWYFLGVLMFAILVGAAPAAWVNRHAPLTQLTVGFNEEFWKCFPLLLLMYFAPTTVTGVRDGMIYGALGGFAFNCVEIGDYILHTKGGGIEGLSLQLTRLGSWGIGNHVIWAMLVGAGLGMIVQTKKTSVKILAPLGAYLLAALTHDFQDSLGAPLLGIAATYIVLALQGQNPARASADKELMRSNAAPALQLEPVLANLIIIPILLRLLWTSGAWERSVIADELADEVGGAVTAEEYDGVLAEKRFRLRRVNGYPKRVARKIRTAQNDLAFQKHFLRRRGLPLEGDQLAAYYRAAIAELRDEGAPAGVSV